MLPLADRHNAYAHEVAAALAAAELRADVDDRTESVGRKIREAELRKCPYMLVLGTASRRSAGWRCAAMARATRGRSRSPTPCSGSPAKRPEPNAARSCVPLSILRRVDQAFPHSSAAYSLTPRRTAIA